MSRILYKDEVGAVLEPLLAQSEPTSLEDELLEAGVPDSAIRAVRKIVQREAVVIAGGAFRQLIRSLGTSAFAVALGRVLLEKFSDPLEADAARAGVTKQALCSQVGRIRKNLNEKWSGR